MAGGDLDQEPTPRPRVQLGRHQMPVVRREHPGDLRRVVQGPDADHQLEDGLGRQTRDRGAAHVVDVIHQPRGEQAEQAPTLCGGPQRPARVRLGKQDGLRRPGGPLVGCGHGSHSLQCHMERTPQMPGARRARPPG